MKNNLALFEKYKIRRSYDEETETWFFSVIDIVQILTNQSDYQTARKYWNKLKERLKKEGNESVTNCHQLKMTAEDGKARLTDVENNKIAGRQDGGIAKKTRLALEEKTGKKVVSNKSYLSLHDLINLSQNRDRT